MDNFRKITEDDMLARLRVGEVALKPLIVKSIERDVRRAWNKEIDARLGLALPGSEGEVFTFIVETKSRSVPQLFEAAVNLARQSCGPGEWPMVQMPYLSPDRIAELEERQVSGIDLCGNGVVIVPGRIYVVRTGQPNQFPESRALANPYRGRSAMVARTLLKIPQWESLGSLVQEVSRMGTSLSTPQVSKAVQAMEEDRMLGKEGGTIRLRDALPLLDKLSESWKGPKSKGRQAIRLDPGVNLPAVLSSRETLRWAVTGSSSVQRYGVFGQGGPLRIAVSSLPLALDLLGVRESLPANFADYELMETEEEGYFFDNEVASGGMRWASVLQTWIELQAGDARQQDAARDLRSRLLNRTS